MRPSSAPCPRRQCNWTRQVDDRGANHGSIRSHNFRRFVTEGELISFGIDQAALYRLATSYVDRILKGEKPADLPVQAPTKYETVLNIKTAKATRLGSTAECVYPCRRGGRMKLLLHLLTSLHGMTRTSRDVRFFAAVGVIADVTQTSFQAHC
jgi:ABC transporter substrate binding protein